ncbi:hypothetical protein [Acaryochloris sp. CCMEE 5410]|uniref:hypothetical protein n=1 Tax=Acaryochloris sp. CCMEE 5410 TaxID=310037 RepID=UPI0002485168|nr:hypothetical protein [Acaryochloris sp. CCMEE 5410]KAI9130147.1 hypothetical protein ON05_031465 [Acaryochloris sp. CCMEE 5410]
MPTVTNMNIQLDPDLAQWTRDYVTLKPIQHSSEDLQALLKPLGLLETTSSSADDILASIGIAMICNYAETDGGPGPVAISPTTSPETAKQLLETYQQPSYQQLRQSMGVTHHWIVLLGPDLLHDSNEMLEETCDWRVNNDPHPECSIISLVYD